MGRLMAAVRGPGFDRYLVPVFLIAFALARAGRFEERDPYWQARAGAENLAGWPLARLDTWSWSGVGGLWYQNSPLWDTLLGLAYGVGGFWGFYAFTAAVLASYFLLGYVLAQRLGARRLPALAGIVASVSPALAMLSPRGTLVVEVLMLFAVLVAVEWARRDDQRLPDFAAGAIVMLIAAGVSLLGNQMHLSFLVIGPAMAGVWAVVWLLSPWRWSRRIVLTIAGVIGWGSGVFFSPYGLAAGLERTRVVQEVCTGLILEWNTPFSSEVPPVFWLMVSASTLAAATVTVWLMRRWRRREWSLNTTGVLALAVIGVPAAAAGWFAIRFLGIALLMLAPAVAVIVTAAVDRLRAELRERPATRWREYTTGAFWRVVIATTMVALSPGLFYLISLHAVPAEAGILRQLPAQCRLFSSGAIGGSSVLLRPDVLVWMDGRADFYGRAHLIDAYGYFWQTNPTVVPDGATCVVLDTSASDSQLLVQAVSNAPQWRQIAADGPFRLWVPTG